MSTNFSKYNSSLGGKNMFSMVESVEKICLVWLNLLKHVVSFAPSEKLGMYKKCIGEY